MADAIIRKEQIFNNLYYTGWKALLQQVIFWHLIRARTFSEAVVNDIEEYAGSSMEHGQCHRVWRSSTQHDERLMEVMNRLKETGVLLNNKCEYSKPCLNLSGRHNFSERDEPDPNKIAAIKNMEPPKDVSGVRRIFGMINQLSKFFPNFAECTIPLRELWLKEKTWSWGAAQRQAL